MSDEQTISPQDKYMKYSDEQLGTGSFKVVHKCINVHTGIEYAWNEVNLEKYEAPFNAKIFQEIQMYKLCEHPNILKLYDNWFNDDNVLIFTTELLDNGSLYKYVQKIGQYLTLSVLQKWLVQILNALNYLHTEKRIIHRDLKSGNVYIDAQSGIVKVGDLGLATLQDFKDVDMDTSNFAQSIVGTQGFMAPEIYTQTYDEKIDIFSFGMLLIELITKETPYSECKHTIQIYNKIREGCKPDAFNQIKHPILIDLINQAIEQDYTKRPSAAQLLQHVFFKTNFGNELVSQWVQKENVNQSVQQPSNSFASTVNQQMAEVSPKKVQNYDQNIVNLVPSVPVSIVSPASGILNQQMSNVPGASSVQQSSQIFQKQADRLNSSPTNNQQEQKQAIKKQDSYLNITVSKPADKAKDGTMVIFIRYKEDNESRCSKFIVEQNDTLDETTSMLEDVIPTLKQLQSKLRRILGQLFQDRENNTLKYEEVYE